MSGSKLDQIVKGAPPPGSNVPAIISRATSSISSEDGSQDQQDGSVRSMTDSLSLLSSSPEQIYLNLLVLEASLRAQYLALRDRRRQNTFFLFLLSLWLAGFTYLLFLRPREDGSGVGGSVYWVVEMAEKMALMGGVVTAILIWGTGQWERGIRWPRRWVGIANRGLRSINAKIVVMKGPWWRELLGHLIFLFPYSALFPSTHSSYRYVKPGTSSRTKHSNSNADAPSSSLGKNTSSNIPQDSDNDDDESLAQEEDLSPGGDTIRLLLLPKPFSPDFREKWDLYRLEYWERENERRARLRVVLRKREREIARQEAGYFPLSLSWWLGWRRPRHTHTHTSSSSTSASTYSSPRGSNSKHAHHHHHHHNPSIDSVTTKTRRSDSSHSRSSVSRATTPDLDGSNRSSSTTGTSVGSSKSRKSTNSGSTTGSERRRKTGKISIAPNTQTGTVGTISRPA